MATPMQKPAQWQQAKAGYMFAKGALDFAGGTVVHINAAVAGLIGAYFLGKRRGYGKEALYPHDLTMTMIGASLLWFGWFGFNAGSALEANGIAGLAFINTWLPLRRRLYRGCLQSGFSRNILPCWARHPVLLSGLVAITPACGFVGVGGALVIGLLAGVVCLWGVTGLKKLLGADDSLDVFGVHGVGGILGAMLTGVFAAPALGGTSWWDYVANAPGAYDMAAQLKIQAQGVLTTIVISGVVAAVAYKLIDLVIGLRVDEEAEVMGLDVSSHGERAYND